MKQTLRYACAVLLITSLLTACNGSNNSTTGTDSTSTTTTDTTNNMNKMSDSNSMNRMTDSAARDTGGRNTQNVPPPKPKAQ